MQPLTVLRTMVHLQQPTLYNHLAVARLPANKSLNQEIGLREPMAYLHISSELPKHVHMILKCTCFKPEKISLPFCFFNPF